jgi:multisubunit Na+/H+ antiporter MnhE subunit
MIYFAVIIASLTATYCLTLASFAWEDVTLGVVLAATLAAVYRKSIFPSRVPEARYVLHILLHMPRFVWMLLVDVLKGTWIVAVYVVGVRKLDHPGIVKIPLTNHSPAGVGIVGLLLTLSPGSFLVDIDWDDRSMLVHYIDASNPDKLRREAERYYRLWEYGAHIPGQTGESVTQQETK